MNKMLRTNFANIPFICDSLVKKRSFLVSNIVVFIFGLSNKCFKEPLYSIMI